MQPKYKQEPLLPKLERDLIYPLGFVELAKLEDHLNGGDVLYLFRYDRYVVLCEVAERTIKGEKRFIVGQFEAPLEMLTWFPQSLGEFIKPSAQGGPRPGTMTSRDENVGGEMLCVQRAMDAGNGKGGYVIVNRSRPSRLYHGYNPSRITFPENFLYQGGLLNLIKTLGEKYQRGEL